MFEYLELSPQARPCWLARSHAVPGRPTSSGSWCCPTSGGSSASAQAPINGHPLFPPPVFIRTLFVSVCACVSMFKYRCGYRPAEKSTNIPAAFQVVTVRSHMEGFALPPFLPLFLLEPRLPSGQAMTRRRTRWHTRGAALIWPPPPELTERNRGHSKERVGGVCDNHLPQPTITNHQVQIDYPQPRMA